MDEEVINANGFAQTVDRGAIVPERSRRHHSYRSSKLPDYLRNLICDRRIQVVKKANVAIAGFAVHGTAKIGGDRIALFAGAVPNALRDGE